MKSILSILLFVTINYSCYGQCNPKLKKYAVGFKSIDASSFSFLDQPLKEVKIVGYGEDTHGTSEFTTMAGELMKYLAKSHGFNILILETGFGEAQYFDDYIQGRIDNLASIMDTHNSSWRYDTKEFYALLDTFKHYNTTTVDKIKIYGCEMQYVVAEVERVREYLLEVNSDYQIDGFEKHIWQPIEEGEKSDYYISYMKLKTYFHDNMEHFKEKTSEAAFNLAYHHVEVLGQFVTVVNQNVVQRKHDFRDIYMAENIQWILNHEEDGAKALYWAHNAHVGDWISNGIVDVAGHQLKKMYGDQYFNIVTDFGTGDFAAFSQEGKMESFGYEQVLEGSFSSCLQSLGSPNVFLNFRQVREEPELAVFLDQLITTMSGAGATVRQGQTEVNDLGSAFDGILYLDHTTKINWAK